MSEERICGNCKHLGKEITVFAECPETGKYDYIGTGYFICGLVKMTGDDELKKGAGAVVQDGSDYMARLLVESDFGCKLFEGKE